MWFKVCVLIEQPTDAPTESENDAPADTSFFSDPWIPEEGYRYNCHWFSDNTFTVNEVVQIESCTSTSGTYGLVIQLCLDASSI